MAIFSMRVDIISRAKGQSAVASISYCAGEKIYGVRDGITHGRYQQSDAVNASAYISGDKLHSEQHGKMHDYTRKSGIVHSEIMLPKHARKEFQDRATLWNSAELAENQWNAQTARKVVIALPVEFDRKTQIEKAREFVRKNFVDEGMCADLNIHDTGDGNPHAHIQLTMRPLNEDGSWGAKCRKEYILNAKGERIKLPSGNYKSRRVDTTDWDKVETLEKWRENWAKTVNREFERMGLDERIDHRTLEAQGIDREPTIHVGVEGKALERKGVITAKVQQNRDITKRNIEKGMRVYAEKNKEIQRLEQRARKMTEYAPKADNEHRRNYFKGTFGVDVAKASAEIMLAKAQAGILRGELEQWEKWRLFERQKAFDLMLEREKQRALHDVEHDYTKERIREPERDR